MPTVRSGRCLIMFDGGVPAMVAALIRPRRDDLILWVPPVGSPSLDCDHATVSPASIESAGKFARWAGLPEPVVSPNLQWPEVAPPDAATLLLACREAAERGCDEVVWPIATGEDPDRLFRVDETASLISRLVSLPDPLLAMSPEIRVPLADLSVRQAADIAVDLDTPTELCWWRLGKSGNHPDSGQNAARWLWEGALDEARKQRRGGGSTAAEMLTANAQTGFQTMRDPSD